MKQKLWAVMESCHYGYESYRDELSTGVRLFKDKAKAIEELERIIRNDWTVEVDVDGETKSLADCRGYPYDDYPKHSECHYNEDGTLAWAFFSDDHGYRGEVCEVKVNE